MQDSNVTRTWEDTIDFVTQRTKVQGETKIQQKMLLYIQLYVTRLICHLSYSLIKRQLYFEFAKLLFCY